MKKMSGFTLAELIISTSIAVLVGGLLLAIMVGNTGVFYKESSRVTEGVGINDSLVNIRSSIKNAQSVAATYVEGSTTYLSGPDQLILKIPSIDSSGNIISNAYDYIVYNLSGDKLHYNVFPDAASYRQPANRILAGNINSINFSYFDSSGNPTTVTTATRIRVTLSMLAKAGADNEVNVATSEANLRND